MTKKNNNPTIKVMWLMSDQNHYFHQITEEKVKEANLLINKGIVVRVEDKATASGDSLNIGE